MINGFLKQLPVPGGKVKDTFWNAEYAFIRRVHLPQKLPLAFEVQHLGGE
jgi:hypothetical protein